MILPLGAVPRGPSPLHHPREVTVVRLEALLRLDDPEGRLLDARVGVVHPLGVAGTHSGSRIGGGGSVAAGEALAAAAAAAVVAGRLTRTLRMVRVMRVMEIMLMPRYGRRGGVVFLPR